MPEDIGRIPIITFSGCKPLTDILSELPIPQSTHVSIGCRTLLYGPELMCDSERCINCTDPKLVQMLLGALSAVNTDDISFADDSVSSKLTQTPPPLLQLLFDRGALVQEPRDPHPINDTSVSSVITETPGPPEEDTYRAVRIAPLRISLKKKSIVKPAKTIRKATKKKQKGQSEEKAVIPPNSCTQSSQAITVVEVPQPLVDSKPSSVTRLTIQTEVVSSVSAIPVCSTTAIPIDSTNGGMSNASIESHPISTVSTDQSHPTTCPTTESGALAAIEANHLTSDGSKSSILPAPSTTEPSPNQVRRLPDLALSHLFHPTALFHAFRANGEPERSSVDVGGGLFDHWIEQPNKLSETQPDVISHSGNSDGMYSGSISGPASVLANPQSVAPPANSVDASGDLPNYGARSPPSVLSNHSSYPTTPGGHLPNPVGFHPVSAAQPEGAYRVSSQPSPSGLFDNPSGHTDLRDSSMDEQSRMAPHGLAAYLPRSSSLKSHIPNNDYTLDTDLGGLYSPPSDMSPVHGKFFESSTKPASVGKGAGRGSSKDPSAYYSQGSTPTKPCNRSKFMDGKPRGGGRRRRTELEELQIWNVNDRKENNLSSGASPSRVQDVSNLDADALTPSPQYQSTTPGRRKEASDSDLVKHGPFTEALVERVKRRRQQRELESGKLNPRSGSSTGSLADLSPASTPSPMQVLDDHASRQRTATSTGYCEVLGGDRNGSRSTIPDKLSQSSPSRGISHKNPGKNLSSSRNSSPLKDVPSNSCRALFTNQGDTYPDRPGSVTTHLPPKLEELEISKFPHASNSKVIKNSRSPKPPALLPLGVSSEGKRDVKPREPSDSPYHRLKTPRESEGVMMDGVLIGSSRNDIPRTESYDAIKASHVRSPASPASPPVDGKRNFHNQHENGYHSPSSPADSYVGDDQCPTPSTIPYTDSSAMEEPDSKQLTLSQLTQSKSVSHVGSSDSDLDCSPPTPVNHVTVSSPVPSPLSSSCEDNGIWDKNESERDRTEGLTVAAAAMTEFTARLGKILRRVEELDLLKLASEASSLQPHGHAAFDEEDNDYISDEGIPESVRLPRSELTALYTYTAQIRLGGSMYSIPTGRLVRFLTLLLVNIQSGARRVVSPLSEDEIDQFLKRRSRHPSDSSDSQLSESLLWTNPEWSAFMTALDCARIALNLIAAPDMPRPLLMEDVIDGIVSVVKHALDNVICKYSALGSQASRQNSQRRLVKNFCLFAIECVGFRLGQLMAVLSNLTRFQPSRFTDNLVLRLTSLALSIPIYCLKTGSTICRDPKRLSTSLFKRLLARRKVDATSNSVFAAPAGPTRLCLLVWPYQLQRACLSLLSQLYSQYEAHRKLIIEEIFTNLMSLGSQPASVPRADSSNDTHTSSGPDRRTARTFRILSSHWLYTMSTNLRTASHHRKDDQPATNQLSTQQAFIHIHPLTALLLSITQGLIQLPSGSPSSSGSTGRKMSSNEHGSGECGQFQKDEKHVLLSYHTSMRHAHYLLSGLLKKVCSKTESSLRPLVETLTTDLLNVASAAPVEWPATFTLISVLSSLVVQQLAPPNGGQATVDSAKNLDPSAKLVYVDLLSTLMFELKRFTQKSKHAGGGDHSTADSTDEAVQQSRLVAYLSSTIPALFHWMLEPGVTTYPTFDVSTDHQLERECMEWIRLEYSDSLLLSAHRFHLAFWLYECAAREMLAEKKDNSINASKGPSKHARDREQTRRQLMSELVITHHSVSACFPWLLGSRHSSGVVGSSSLSSPMSNGRTSRGTGASNGSCSTTPGKSSSSFGGSILANSLAAIRFIDCAHSAYLPVQYRLRLAAQAHWSARRLLSLHPISPGFEKLFGIICRMVSEAAIPVRSKALRSLASVLELDPAMLVGNENSASDKNAWIRDLPRLIHARLLDQSTAVREAAVDLLSRLLLVRPRSLSNYYTMLSERILDKGVSVRKRAIRCFRDLLAVDWTQDENVRASYKNTLFTRQCGADVCFKLIRRLHDDEESIQKLVVELFANLWFTPIPETGKACAKLLDWRIKNFNAVTSNLRSVSFDTLESSIKKILATDDRSKASQSTLACEQMINRLIVLIQRHTAILFSSETPRNDPRPRQSAHTADPNAFLPSLTLTAELSSLHLLGRSKPKLLLPHLKFLLDLLHHAPHIRPNAQPTPSESSNLILDTQCLFQLIGVIEMALLKLNSDHRDFLDNDVLAFGVSFGELLELQRNLIQLIQRQGRVVVDSAMICLSVLANTVLKDHSQVAVVFRQFYGLLAKLSPELRRALSTSVISGTTTTTTTLFSRNRPSVLRALYTVGLMCKHFQLDNIAVDIARESSVSSLLDEVVDTLMLFAEFAAIPSNPLSVQQQQQPQQQQLSMTDPDLCRKAVMGLSFLVCHYDQLLCSKHLRTFFSRFFISVPPAAKSSTFFEVQCIIVDNLTRYLIEVERRMVSESRSWEFNHKSESLKELSDKHTGHGSAVAQAYLPFILQYCVLTASAVVRTAALSFISVVIRQGLVHPVQMIPSLACLQTDPDSSNRSRASHLMVEAEKKAPGFTAMHATQGVRMAYCLHLLLNIASSDPGRTLSHLPIIRGACVDSSPLALNHQSYMLVRSHRQHRRSFISSLLGPFTSEQGEFNVPHLDALLSDLPHLNAQFPLGYFIFLSDQLAHFPYLCQDEALYVAYTLERLISDRGPSLTRSVQQILLSSIVGSADVAEQAEARLFNLLEAAETKLGSGGASGTKRLMESDEMEQLQSLIKNARPASGREQIHQLMVNSGSLCFMLLSLRNRIRDLYGVTDSKLKDYSPSDPPKQWDKPLNSTVKRPSPSPELCKLPVFVEHCMRNPNWFVLSPSDQGPSDTFILEYFIRLRQQLLSVDTGLTSEGANDALDSHTTADLDDQQEKSRACLDSSSEIGHDREPRSSVYASTVTAQSVEVHSTTQDRLMENESNEAEQRREPAPSKPPSRLGNSAKRRAPKSESSSSLSSATSFDSDSSCGTAHRKFNDRVKSTRCAPSDPPKKPAKTVVKHASRRSNHRFLPSSSDEDSVDSTAGAIKREPVTSKVKARERTVKPPPLQSDIKQPDRDTSVADRPHKDRHRPIKPDTNLSRSASESKHHNLKPINDKLPRTQSAIGGKTNHQSAAVRTLAPLPQAMMQSSHLSRAAQQSGKRKLQATSRKAPFAAASVESRPSNSDRKPARPVVMTAQHRVETSKPDRHKKVRRLSDSSSCSESASDAVAVKPRRLSSSSSSSSSTSVSSVSTPESSLSASSSSSSPIVKSKKPRTMSR